MVGPCKTPATKIWPKAVGGGIFGRFFLENEYQLEVAGDVISSVIVDQTDMDVRVTFGDFRSNCSWDIRTTHFVMDKRQRRRTPANAGHDIRQNAIWRFV